MAGPGLGFKGYLGFGEEAVGAYGTAVTRTHWTEITDESLVLNQSQIESESLYRRGIINTRVEPGARTVSGDIEFEATYEGQGKLFKHAFGAIATSTPDPTSNPTVKRHLYTIQDSLPTGLTVEVSRDQSSFATNPNRSFLYTGVKINSISFSISTENTLRCVASCIGRNETGPVAQSTPSFFNTRLAVYHGGSITWGSTTLEVEDISVTLNNNLEYRPVIGSNLTREPLPSGKLEVTGSFKIEFASEDQYNDFKNSTERVLTMLFQGPNIASSFYKYIKLTANVAKIMSCRVMLNTFGRLVMEIDFKGYRSLTQNELELEIQSTETGI